MKPLDWNEQKNTKLKQERSVGFEDVVNAINDGHLLDTIRHPDKAGRSNQKVYIVKIQDYVYSVPFIEDKDKIFMKTIYPSRKYTKKYLRKGET